MVAILVHGTLNWADRCWEYQRPLAARFPLLLPDRRGFGSAPDLDDPRWTSDYETDAADVVALLGAHGGGHLAGHSYGGVVALLAAVQCPELVRSLTLIEPSAHLMAIDDPTVAAWIETARAAMAGARTSTPEQYLRMAFDDAGVARPEPADRLARAALSALGERPCWLAEIPFRPLAEATFPKLVIAGAWDVPAPGYPPGTGEVLQIVAAAVARKIQADLVRIPGAAHEPHRERPGPTNALLAAQWETGEP